MEHRDQPWQVVSYEVGPDDTGLLAAMGELPSASFSEVEMSEVNDPTLRAAVNRLCSRAPSDIAASISWARPCSGSAAPRTCLDRRREVFGDALIQRGADQLGLGRKPPVERAFTDAGPTGDRLDGSLWPDSP